MNDSSLPLSAMEFPKPSPLSSITTFVHQQLHRFNSEITTRFEESKQFIGNAISNLPLNKQRQQPHSHSPSSSLFASITTALPKHAFDIALSSDYVAKTLAGTAVYTVSNSNNEFVLISDPNNIKSLGILCFRQEDAETLLAQVQLKQPILCRGAKVVPITLDQVYMLKVEGIAFRFLPDPAQIRNALELKAADLKNGFDGVPVFQSDLLVVRKKNKRYCPIYFQKEDLEKELMKVTRISRGSGLSQNIVMSDKNSGWEDLIFIPPGKSYSQHVQEVAMG
ncbi:hypothetical protein AQUCO_01500080v1 [Aquilegia coerulea]|uniref:Protein TIC 22, chloroplastic n=1 Tax=Aquilegia coerulea TaxID=218851 RepID=A0A2G5DS14_AQUCA|nr:hypothetical protein AQUCO_01500080v1 [Aquilegia coerulea]